METREEHIEQLKRAVLAAFGQTLDAPTDYERLSADIQNKTGEVISTSTLKRLFGYIKPGTIPRPSTLSVLARYVGSTGWSDFCAKCSPKEVAPEPCPVPARSVRRHSFVYWAVAVVCLVGLLGVSVWSLVREKNPSVPLSIRNENLPEIVSNMEETNDQKYERLLHSFVAMSKEKCDSVRACRQNMDLESYKKLVDSVYFPFVFTVLQDSIKRQTERLFPEDELLRVRYSNDIFAQCREICVELMREISAEELRAAYKHAQ